ncbi:MAG: carbonic anhydrase [Elusimicrobia bacterium GWF2_62_30]|nr:MAG: carbonic anhydrase [Elusimicrobia bacterium GWF2_62_30]
MTDPRLKAVRSVSDIPKHLRGTPFADLLQYHNLDRDFKKYDKAGLLVCMCMDNRKQLRLPDNFAYIIRTGGGNIRYSEFKVSFAVGIGDVRHVVMIAHDNCGMSNLFSKKEAFIKGLMKNAGWSRRKAMDYFVTYAPIFEIGNEIDFVVAEARRLNFKYPKVKVLPMYYRIADGKLYLLKK